MLGFQDLEQFPFTTGSVVPLVKFHFHHPYPAFPPSWQWPPARVNVEERPRTRTTLTMGEYVQPLGTEESGSLRITFETLAMSHGADSQGRTNDAKPNRIARPKRVSALEVEFVPLVEELDK